MITSLSVNPDNVASSLSYKDALYLATLGGAKALAMENEIGSFEVGKRFDALVVSAADNIDVFDDDSREDVFQKLMTLGDDRNILRVYIQGVEVKCK